MRALQPVQSLCMYPKVQQMARVARHTAARAARPGKGAQHNGCNKAHAHLLHCPKACSAKAASAVLHMLAGQPARFCSVFRAWCFAATAFAKQGTRCEDFEQALGRRFARLRTCMAACATASTNRPSTKHSATSSTAHPMTLSLSTTPSTAPPAAQRAAVVFQPCLAAIGAIWPNRQASASRYQKLLAPACACSHCFYKISQQTIHLVRIKT